MSYLKSLLLTFAFLTLAFGSSQAQFPDTLIYVKAPLRAFVLKHFEHLHQGQQQALAQDFKVSVTPKFNDTMLVFRSASFLRPGNVKAVRMGSGEGNNMVFVHISAAVDRRLPYDQLRNPKVAAYARRNGLDPRHCIALKIAPEGRSYRVLR